MRPEVWVPAAATLAAPLVPTIATWVVRTLRGDERPAPAPSRPRRLAALAAIPVAAAVWLAPDPWNWAAACAYVAALASVLAWSRVRAARHPQVLPEAERLLEDGARPGFEYDRDFLPDLVRVYTENDLAGGRGGQEPPNPDKPQETAAEQRVSFDRIIADPKVRHIAITGEAGVGKTFLLRYWEHELRRRPPSSADPASKYRPLLIAARRLVGCASIAEAFGRSGDDTIGQPPGKGLYWLVMIDAFDEITDAADRAAVERLVFDAIEDAGKRKRAHKFVITTRGLTDDRRRSFETRGVAEYELQVFTAEQLHAFLVNAETSIPDRQTRSPAYEAAVAKADRFLNRWEDEDDLLDLVKLPLLARVAATVYFQDRHLELPSRRIDIYHDAVEHWIAQFHKRMDTEREKHGPALRLLHAWHRCEGEGAEATDAAIRALLRRLAVRYLETGQRPVVGIACDLLELQVRPKDPGELEALVTLLEATGLVHDVRTIGSHFVHKSYAEYLAAPETLDRYPTPAAWNEAFADPERRISAVFAFAHVPHEERAALIEQMRGDPGCVYALGWIAAEGLCVVKGTGRIDHEVRNALIEAVIKAWPPYPKPAWWLLLGGLCNIGHARDVLAGLVESGWRSTHDRVQMSDILASHDPRGVALLLGFTAAGNSPGVRARAAMDLASHDRALAKGILEGIESDPELPGGARFSAVQALVLHWPEQSLPLVRRLATDTRVDFMFRTAAVDLLLQHDRSDAERLLTEFQHHRGLDGFALASVALSLREIDDRAGVAALRELVSNRGLQDYERVHAASSLAREDRERGVELLWGLVEDPTVDVWATANALRNLREYDEEAAERRQLSLLADSTSETWGRLHALRTLNYDGAPVDVALLESIVADPTEEDFVRAAALDDLASVDPAKALAQLHEFAADRSLESGARVSAAMYLSQLDFSLGVAMMEGIAAEPAADDHTHQRALSELVSFGRPAARARLQAFAEDPANSGWARIGAVGSLMPRLGEQGLAILRGLAVDERLRPEEQASAIAELVHRDEREDLNRLVDLAADTALHEDARVKAASELMRHLPDKAAALLHRIATGPEVSDDGRVSAANELIPLDLAAAVPLLDAIAEDAEADDEARVNAARAVARVDKRHARALLLPLAQDTGLYQSNAVDAAYWLRKYGDDRGLELTIAHTADRDLDDQARVRSASNLLEFDREQAMPLLTAFAADGDLDEVAQTDAANTLARLDRETGLRALRAIAAQPPSLGGRAVRAAARIATYSPDEGTGLLRAMVESEDESTRVHAANLLAYRDRSIGLPILRSLAEGGACDPFANEVAARLLFSFDRPAGTELLRAVMEDTSAPPLARVEAADDLPAANLGEAMALWGRFADDPGFDGIGRAASAFNMSFGRKRDGLDRLRAFMTDPRLDATEQSWALIALACRDKAARAELAARTDGRGVDFARLRAAADSSVTLNLRTGRQLQRSVRALEARAAASSMHE